MDVRCGRCGTEYEFDDALISERGTTVKCTNCGFQFRVFPDLGASAPERWVVQTQAGRELLYTSLRDLQRGIAKGHVGPQDLLSRGQQPPRPLLSIPELEPFLQSEQSTQARRARSPRTLHGVAPASHLAAGGEGPATAMPEALRRTAPGGTTLPLSVQNMSATLKLNEENKPATAEPHLRAASDSAPAFAATELSAQASIPPATEVAQSPSLAPLPSESPPATPRGIGQGAAEAAVYGNPPRGAPVQGGYSAPGPAPFGQGPLSESQPTRIEQRSAGTPERGKAALDLEAARMMLQHDEQTDSHYASAPPQRHARSRWLVFVVVLAAGGLLAATVGRRYLEQFTTKASTSVQKADSRTQALLAEGEQLMNKGDLEAARESFAKASVLAENEASVLTAQARLDVVAADMEWLKLRLLDPKNEALVARSHAELGKRVARAQRSISKVKQAAPKAPATQRLRVHEQRLSGDVAGARALVGPLSRDASVPDNAYALATLDMAEEKPAWASIVHRLRIAAPKDTDLGRARAALVYALARWGQPAEARAELDKLLKAAPAHPLAHDLEEFVQRIADQTEQSGEQGDEAAQLDTQTSPKRDTSEDSASAEAGDFRRKLKLAHDASQSGELDKAERLFRAVLSSQPDNTEALSGLAEIASRRNDPNAAARLYARVLEKNPSYLPAQMASADQKWAQGDKSGAVQLYRRIRDQAGRDSPYGRRAQRRIAQAEAEESEPSEAPQANEPEAQPPEPTPEATPAPEDDSTPHIDTTDLPEFNQ